MTPDEERFLNLIDPEGKNFSSCDFMERYESARYYVLSDKKNPERLFEAILDADGRYVILDPDEEVA